MDWKNHLNVFGIRYKIKYESDLDSDGLIEFKKKSIRVKLDTEEEMIKTLLHEGLHAVVRRVGIHEDSLDHNIEELLAECYPTFIMENFDISFKKK